VALTLVLEDPPYGPGVDEAKVSLLGRPIPSHPSFNLILISHGSHLVHLIGLRRT